MVLTPCSPSYLWRSCGLYLPSMRMAKYFCIYFCSFLCLLINNSRNLRLKLPAPFNLEGADRLKRRTCSFIYNQLKRRRQCLRGSIMCIFSFFPRGEVCRNLTWYGTSNLSFDCSKGQVLGRWPHIHAQRCFKSLATVGFCCFLEVHRRIIIIISPSTFGLG